jgi:hypothetical protein
LRAKASATALPMPESPPVIKATGSSSWFVGHVASRLPLRGSEYSRPSARRRAAHQCGGPPAQILVGHQFRQHVGIIGKVSLVRGGQCLAVEGEPASRRRTDHEYRALRGASVPWLIMSGLGMTI